MKIWGPTREFGFLLLTLFVFSISAEAKLHFDVENSRLSLPPPPESGSSAEKRDFEILFKYQSERTEAQCRLAQSHSLPSMKVFYGPKSGLLSEEEFDRVVELGNALIDLAGQEAKHFKKKYERMRPYDENEEIEPCIRRPGGQTSYPSSHATSGYLLGEVLSKVFPEKADSLKKMGYLIGELRILGGVHHPTDVIAGRELGKQILRELAKQQEFREQLP